MASCPCPRRTIRKLAFTITATCRNQNLTTESMTILSRESPKTTQPADSAALLS